MAVRLSQVRPRFLLGVALTLSLVAGFTVALQGPSSAAPIGSAAKFVPLQPERVLDTREGLGAPKLKVPPRGAVDLTILGVGGVPASDVSAVVLNVTITQTSGAGFVQVYPTAQSTPGAFSNINHTAAGQTIAGLVTAPVGDGGRVTL
jgi:hypothetical protein